MKDKAFIDTNIFVYAFHTRDKLKRNKALDIIEIALNDNNACISSQVVQELINVFTKKFTPPLAVKDIKTYLKNVLDPLCQVYPSIELYNYALIIMEETQYSFYDSLIVAAAVKNGCNILLSEDMQHDRNIHGVVIKNPF